jgi:hypothetical protein
MMSVAKQIAHNVYGKQSAFGIINRDPGRRSCNIEGARVGMARNTKQKRTSDSEIDSDEEIWKTIRHLDPDRGLRKSDIVLGATWVLCVILLCVLFLLHH